MYELIIIGGGPAATSAGVYAARKKIKAAVIADSFGGQSIVSDNIENWIGTKSIAGWDLAKQLEEHLRAQEELDIIEDRVNSVSKKDGVFSVKTASGKEYEAKAVMVCSGGRHRHLNVPGEEKFIGKGVVFCSTCDAPLFKGKDVAVIGAGNAGLEAVMDLVPYAEKIYLIVRGEKIKGDSSTYERVLNSGKAEVIFNADTKEIMGDGLVSGLKYTDTASGKEKEIAVQGVFVEIGTAPNSDIVKDLVKLNERGEIEVDPKTGRTSVTGIWAAGDVTDLPYKQSNIAAGDAVRATLNAYAYLGEKE
jgi:alkyl hydroperoxide reductase subunit F